MRGEVAPFSNANQPYRQLTPGRGIRLGTKNDSSTSARSVTELKPRECPASKFFEEFVTPFCHSRGGDYFFPTGSALGKPYASNTFFCSSSSLGACSQPITVTFFPCVN